MLPAQALRSLSEPSTTVLCLPSPQCTSLPMLHHSCTTLLLDTPSVSHTHFIPVMPFLELFPVPSTSHSPYPSHPLSNGASLMKQPQFSFHGRASSFPESPFSFGRTAHWDLVSEVTVSGLILGPCISLKPLKTIGLWLLQLLAQCFTLKSSVVVNGCHSTLRKH